MRDEGSEYPVVRCETTYLSADARELAGLIVQDGDFPFDGLPEHRLRELYEWGQWFGLGGQGAPPGLLRLCRMIDEGQVSYVLYQQDGGDPDVSLSDYLLNEVPSENRSGSLMLMALGMEGSILLCGAGELDKGVGLLCDRVHEQVVCGALLVDRLPLLLREVVRKEMGRLTSVFAEAFRKSRKSGTGRGVCIHRILAGVGCGEVYVVSEGVPKLLTEAGLRLELGGNVHDAVFELDVLALDTDMMAAMVVYSELAGDEVPILLGLSFRRDRTYEMLQKMVSDMLCHKNAGSFFAFSTTPWVASPVMSAIRKIVGDDWRSSWAGF